MLLLLSCDVTPRFARLSPVTNGEGSGGKSLNMSFVLGRSSAWLVLDALLRKLWRNGSGMGKGPKLSPGVDLCLPMKWKSFYCLRDGSLVCEELGSTGKDAIDR